MFADNQGIAIMTQLNELAQRHGLLPAEFYAVLNAEEDGRCYLRFSQPATGDPKADRFGRLLLSLGLTKTEPDDFTLWGTKEEILAAVDGALKRTPKPRRR